VRAAQRAEVMSIDIEARIAALIASKLHVDQSTLRHDATIAGDLGADSLDLVSLILAIEDEFQVDIHDEDAAEILTVEQMIEYVTFALATKEAVVRRPIRTFVGRGDTATTAREPRGS
jgi:acyl carrier protein